MIEQVDRNRRVEQRTCDNNGVAQEVIEEVGHRQFMAYRLLRQEHRSQRDAAKYLGCHRRTAERWARQVETVVDRLREQA